MQDNKVTFSFLKSSKVDYRKYGFSRVAESEMLFNYKKITSDKRFKNFIEKNFEDVAKCFHIAYVYDSTKDPSRRGKIFSVLKSMFDQEHMDVPLLIIKAIKYYNSQGVEESEIVANIVNKILPFSGFCKQLNENRRYVWKINKYKKFKKGIGKAFVINYINNDFNNTKTYHWLKKHCFFKDHMWHYKSVKSKNSIDKYFEDYLNCGGVDMSRKENEDRIVNTNEEKENTFEAFIPLEKEIVEGLLKDTPVGEAEKNPMLIGVASTTGIDSEDERISKSFLKKLRRQAKDKPVLDNTHYAAVSRQTIGVITKSGGDEDNLEITVRLMKRSDSKEVDFILKQMETGIKYGFSIGGKITKIGREYNEKLKKTIYVLDDGDLFHVALTSQPVNQETFANAIVKSMVKPEPLPERNAEELEVELKHSSSLSKEVEPEEVNVEELPDVAYPKNHYTQELYKDYPHHYVRDDVLYLHKHLLEDCYYKAVEEEAPKSVISHLTNHLCAIGCSLQVEKIQSLAKSIDNLESVKGTIEELSVVLKSFFDERNEIRKLENSKERLEAVKKAIESRGDLIEELIDKLERD